MHQTLLPYEMVYALFCAWRKEQNASGAVESQKVVTGRLKKMALEDDMWVPATNAKGTDMELWLASWMTGHEPVLAVYDRIPDVVKWDWIPVNLITADQQSRDGITTWMKKKARARGLVRRVVWEAHQEAGTTPASDRKTLALALLADVMRCDRADVETLLPTRTSNTYFFSTIMQSSSSPSSMPWHAFNERLGHVLGEQWRWWAANPQRRAANDADGEGHDQAVGDDHGTLADGVPQAVDSSGSAIGERAGAAQLQRRIDEFNASLAQVRDEQDRLHARSSQSPIPVGDGDATDNTGEEAQLTL